MTGGSDGIRRRKRGLLRKLSWGNHSGESDREAVADSPSFQFRTVSPLGPCDRTGIWGVGHGEVAISLRRL
jgi:hypothetical protein